jgi:hypothetical protein
MNQRQMIVAAVAVGLVSAALWVWHQSADNPDGTPAQAAATPANPFSPSPAQVAASSGDSATLAPAPATQRQAEPVPAPDVDQSVASVPVDPPNVDTPEPAERKFAQGGRPKSDQN